MATGKTLRVEPFGEPLTGHTGAVHSVAFSPDGDFLASGGNDGTVQFWAPTTGAHHVFHYHTGAVNSVAFSFNGRLASGGNDGTVRFWSMNTGPPGQLLADDSGAIQCVTFSRPDGTQIASAGRDGTVRLWDVAARLLDDPEPHDFKLSGHSPMAWCVAFSPDGTQVASSGGDDAVRLWDAETGEEQRRLANHSGGAWYVAFSPDGVLATAAVDGTVRLWNPTTGQELQELTRPGGTWFVAFSPDGVLATAAVDGTVRLWNPTTGQELQELTGHTDSVTSVAFDRSGTLIATSSSDSTIRLWKISSGEGELAEPALAGESGARSDQAPVRDVNSGWKRPNDRDRDRDEHQEPDPGSLAQTGRSRPPADAEDRPSSFANEPSDDESGDGLDAGGPDQRRAIQSRQGATNIQRIESQVLTGHNGPVRAVAFSPDGTLLASAGRDSTVRLWDPETGNLLRTLTGHTDWVNSLAFNPEITLLASAGRDSTVRLWDPETGNLLRTLTGHTGAVRTVVIHPGSYPYLATGSVDSTIRLWNYKTGAGLRTLTGHSDWVSCLAFNPEGTRLASGSSYGIVYVWDVEAGQQAQTLTGYSDTVLSVAFDHEGEVLASGGTDGTIQLWNPETGEALHTLTGHAEYVRSVIFNPPGPGGAEPPHGNMLASGSDDGTIQLWNPETGEALHTLTGHADRIRSIAFGPGGTALASASADQTVRLWDLTNLPPPLADEHSFEGLPQPDVNPKAEAKAVSAGADYVVAMSADVPAERDLLGVEHEARGLARVLVARETQPPLAVALLGDWGTGKSTFMNLLRNEVEGLRERAARHVLRRGELEASPYCAGVRSIEFNAWHYADDHLWAGLIRHILRELADDSTVADAEKTLVENQRREIEEELGKAREQLIEMDRELEEARQEAEHERLEAEHRQMRTQIGPLKTKDAPRGLRIVFRWLLGPDQDFEDSKRTFDAAARFASTRLRQHWRRLVALAVAAAAAWIVGLWLGLTAESAVGWIITAAAALGTVVTALHGWAVVSLGAWRERVAELAEELGRLSPATATRDAEIAHRSQIARRESLAARVDELEAELADTDPDRRLTRFLRQRSESADYNAYRGLLSLVHDDLTELTDLIAKQVDAWQPSEAEEAANEATGVSSSGGTKLPLQRVMLYIDDLDRCEPKKVVEVLAAIHLILAMRLFVVVVAVDPRWLLRCLRHHYIELLDADDDDATLGPHASTPIDYLEKIFQVAYEVPPMLPGLSGLVRELMPLRPEPGETSDQPIPPEDRKDGPELNDPSLLDDEASPRWDPPPPLAGEPSPELNEPRIAPDNTTPPPPPENPPGWNDPPPPPAWQPEPNSSVPPRDRNDQTRSERDRLLLAEVRQQSSELRRLTEEVRDLVSNRDHGDTIQISRLRSQLDDLIQRGNELAGSSANTFADTEMAWYESETELFNQRQLIDRLKTDLQCLHSEIDAEQARLLDFTQQEIEAVQALGPLLRTPRTVKRLVNVYRMLRATAPQSLQERLATDYRYVLILLAVTLGHPLSAPWLFSLIRQADSDDLGTALTASLAEEQDKLRQDQSSNTAFDRPSLDQTDGQDDTTSDSQQSNAAPSTRDPLDDKLPGPTLQQLAELRWDLHWIIESGNEPSTQIDKYQVWLPHVARFSFRARGLSPPPGIWVPPY